VVALGATCARRQAVRELGVHRPGGPHADGTENLDWPQQAVVGSLADAARYRDMKLRQGGGSSSDAQRWATVAYDGAPSCAHAGTNGANSDSIAMSNAATIPPISR
jgi:hypothetical protein